MDPAQRKPRDQQGFTLIELMVVVLVIAVLIAIAIPTYLGARTRAADRGSQQNVRSAFVAARIFYAGGIKYTADPVEMTKIEPALTWTNAVPSTTSAPSDAFIQVTPDEQTVVVGIRGRNGHCFFIEDIMSAPGTGTHYYGDTSGGPTCSPPASGDPAWASGW